MKPRHCRKKYVTLGKYISWETPWTKVALAVMLALGALIMCYKLDYQNLIAHRFERDAIASASTEALLFAIPVSVIVFVGFYVTLTQKARRHAY